MNNREIGWINFAKCVAILAVLLDHSYNILYFNENIWHLSFFSVSLFILVSGFLSYESVERHDFSWGKTFWRSSRKIIFAYLTATAVYYIWIYRFFDLSQYIHLVTSFNMSGPFYYVALYIQLMIIAKPLYIFIQKIPGGKKIGCVVEAIIGIFILMISRIFYFSTNIMYLYGGAGKFLGGTYLFLFYLGMICAKHKVFYTSCSKQLNVMTIVSGLCLVLWCFFIYNNFWIEQNYPKLLGEGINPPGISLMVYAILMLFFSCGLYNLLSKSSKVSICFKIVDYVGRHTLYIFLYHRFFLDYILPSYFTIDALWIKRIVYFTVMIIAPMILERIFNTFCELFKEKELKL